MGKQAFHHYLWPRVLDAYQGKPIPKNEEFEDGLRGSTNYRQMELGAGIRRAYNAKDVSGMKKAADRWLEMLANMEETGHNAIRGPGGVACEQRVPASHASFGIFPIVSTFELTTTASNVFGAKHPLYTACLNWIGRQVQITKEFTYDNGISYVPCPRAKDEKNMEPTSVLDDCLYGIVFGKNLPRQASRNPHWWTEPSGYGWAARVLRYMCVMSPKLRTQLQEVPFPKLYAPIHRLPVRGGGFLAWLERDDSLLDPCSSVLICTRSKKFVYDWGPLPDLGQSTIVDGAEPEILGG